MTAALPAWDLYADAEALCVSTLAGLDVTVQQVGATMEYPNVVETATIQIDARAATKKAARDVAYEARSLLLRLPYTEPGTAGRVAVVQGPSWLPEPDGEPRYVTTVTVTCRARNPVTITEGDTNG